MVTLEDGIGKDAEIWDAGALPTGTASAAAG
jgi:hypothetical protein